MQTNNNIILSSYLSFNLGDEIFAVNVEKVLKILEMEKITKIPKAPDFVKGVISNMEQALVVIDTRMKFNITGDRPTETNCIIVFEVERDKTKIMIGAVVDSVKEVLEIDNNCIQKVPTLGNYNDTDFLKGIYKTNDGFVIILDVKKVLVDDEIFSIQELSGEIESIFEKECENDAV